MGIFQASYLAELKFHKDQLQISQDNNRILHDKYMSLLNTHDKLKVEHQYLRQATDSKKEYIKQLYLDKSQSCKTINDYQVKINNNDDVKEIEKLEA